ncbi:MAG: GNAT family N-acetyltransferase, partial [Chitinophagaceae bacterium]
MTKTQFDRQPTLENDLLILRPLKEDDFEDLYAVASDPLIWEQHPQKDRCKREVFEGFFKEAMESGGAFAVIDQKTNQMIGSTRFKPVKESDNAIEIGWTFLARTYWGGNYNRSMKNLLINYAFNLVEHVLFYVHGNNTRSRKAVEKIGGVLIT